MTVEEALAMAKEIDEASSDVSSWESEFLESILGRLECTQRPLTPKQERILKELHERYCRG